MMMKAYGVPYMAFPSTSCWMCLDGFTDETAQMVYEKKHGVLPEGGKLLRTCDMEKCINPKHYDLTGVYTKKDAAMRPGTKNGNAKLSEAQVLEIRKLSADGMIAEEICKLYGVSRATASHIIRRKTWTHL